MTIRNKKKHENRKKKKKEFTFVLGLPLVFNRGTVGEVLREFANIGLKLIDFRCMTVTTKFIKAHFQKKGTGGGLAVGLATEGPFLAMKFEGVNAVKRAFEFVSKKEGYPFSDYRWPFVYCSDTVQSAQEDAAMWFRADSIAFEKQKERKDLVFRLYDGSICSGSTEEELRKINSRIDFSLERANQRFVLIKPKAIQDGIMPKLLISIERICYYIKGLKLVKKSEFPQSAVWSDGTREKEFGIALIVCPPNKAFDEEGSLCLGDHITSDLVYVSAKGESLKLAEEFFEFGIVGWVDPVRNYLCGGKFEPTLTGFLYEDQP